MSRYIDGTWLLNFFVGMPDGYTLTIGNLRAVVNDAPSIDIVHCQDCKYWKESQYYPEVMACTYVKGATFTRQHDDFCSRGERKSDE